LKFLGNMAVLQLRIGVPAVQLNLFTKVLCNTT
jgi:hypothetical protein